MLRRATPDGADPAPQERVGQQLQPSHIEQDSRMAEPGEPSHVPDCPPVAVYGFGSLALRVARDSSPVWAEHEREHEEQRLDEDDRGPRSQVEVEAHVQAHDRRYRRERDGQGHHPAEAHDQELRRRGRRHQHRDDHDDPDRLDADDDRDPEQRQQEVLEPRHGQPGRRRSQRVERGEQELLADDEDDGQHDPAEHRDLDQVRDPDAEHVAEQIAQEIGDVAIDRAEQHHAERERAGEQHADRRVEPKTATARDEPDRKGGRDGRDRPAEVQGRADDVGDDQSRERGVADGVADEREALEDHEGAHDRAHDPDEQRRDQAALHEAVRHRVGEEADRSISARRRGSAARRAPHRGGARRR